MRNGEKIIKTINIGVIAFALLGSAVLIGASGENAQALDLYFVRHAETVANATGRYSENAQNIFSKEGESQIAELTRTLSGQKFDAVCVSPQKRTRSTILPYLKEANITAEIWPELDECCYQANRNVQPTPMAFAKDREIILDEAEKKYFKFRDAGSNYFYKGGNYADGLQRIRKARDLISERFGGSGQSVLIVGHNLSGGRLIEMLMGKDPDGSDSPGNARLWHLQEQPDGKFKLIRFNIHPAERYFRKSD